MPLAGAMYFRLRCMRAKVHQRSIFAPYFELSFMSSLNAGPKKKKKKAVDAAVALI